MRFLDKLGARCADIRGGAPLLVGFLGDSVTHGCFEHVCGKDGKCFSIYDFEAAYPNQLRRRLQERFIGAPIGILNAGIAGDNACSGSRRVRADIIGRRPDLAVVCYGLNDAGGRISDYTDGLGSIFSQLREAEIEVVFMTPNMMCTYFDESLAGDFYEGAARSCCEVQVGGRMDEFMEAARIVCAAAGVSVCDCYAKWKAIERAGGDVTRLLSNKINHPDRGMHALFADSLFDTLLLG